MDGASTNSANSPRAASPEACTAQPLISAAMALRDGASRRHHKGQRQWHDGDARIERRKAHSGLHEQRDHEIERHVCEKEAEGRDETAHEGLIAEQRDFNQRRTAPVSDRSLDAGKAGQQRATGRDSQRGHPRSCPNRRGAISKASPANRTLMPMRSSCAPNRLGWRGINHMAASARTAPIGPLTKKMVRHPSPAGHRRASRRTCRDGRMTAPLSLPDSSIHQCRSVDHRIAIVAGSKNARADCCADTTRLKH